jgi:hypothetical protein
MRSNSAGRRFGLVLAVASTALASGAAAMLAACFCGDACDTPDELPAGSYRLHAAAAGEATSLSFDKDAGTVTVTREDGRRTVERWRVVSSGADHDGGH